MTGHRPPIATYAILIFMTLTITLPDDIASQLKLIADVDARTVQELAADLIRAALPLRVQNERLPNAIIIPPTVELDELAIYATMPPDPNMVIAAEGSLLEALQTIEPDPNFDLDAWQSEWAAIELELKAYDPYPQFELQ